MLRPAFGHFSTPLRPATSHIKWGREMGGATGLRTRKKHPDKALSFLGIRAIENPGRYADGNGQGGCIRREALGARYRRAGQSV